MHLGDYLTWIFANKLRMKSDEDSNQKEQWQNVAHDKVWIAEESAAASKISEDTCPVTFATGQFRASVRNGTTGCVFSIRQLGRNEPFLFQEGRFV